MAVVLIRYDTVYSDVFSFCYFWATEREQKVHDILANVVFLFTVRMGFYLLPVRYHALLRLVGLLFLELSGLVHIHVVMAYHTFLVRSITFICQPSCLSY